MADSHVVSTGFTKFEHVTVGVLYLLFFVMGVSSNLLTALTFYKDTRLLSRSKAWLHILLAIANVAVVAPSPFPASSSFSGKWLYGDALCQAYAFEGMFVGILAIGAVFALCVERYVVSKNTSPQDMNSGWFYTWTIILLICNAFFWAVMPLLGWSKYTTEHTGTSCAIDWSHPDERYISYIVTLEVFSFGIPMVAAGVCLYRVRGQGQGQTPVATGSAATSGQGQDVTAQSPRAELGFTEDQLKMLCYIFLLFVLVGWGPFAFLCTSTMISGAEGLSMLAACIPPLACKLMVSAYPLAYAITSARFRTSFLAIIGATDAKQD